MSIAVSDRPRLTKIRCTESLCAPSAMRCDFAPALRHDVGDYAVDAEQASSSVTDAAMPRITSTNWVCAIDSL